MLGAGTLPRAWAQVPVKADLYKDEAIVYEQIDETVRMNADGTGETTLHFAVRAQTEGTAQQLSVLTVSYASAYERADVMYVRVRKPDGTVVETPAADAIDMPAPVTREAPLFSDLKEKQIPVRSLAVGDRLEYEVRTTRTKAEAPGEFWGADHFLVAGNVVLRQTLTLSVPLGTYVNVWSPHHATTPVDAAGRRTWRWESSQLKPSERDKDGKMVAAITPEHDPDLDGEGRTLPSVAWTTFHSWTEVGVWYRGLALDKAQPNETVRAKAEALTKDAKTPEQQADALYQFVSTQVRYVGIDLGIGRYQPHAAEEVLSNQYGDCKDKDTLLEAMLRAKGFTPSPELMGVNVAMVAELPSPALFNHVITTVELPGRGRIWMDATPGIEPFRVLLPMIRDQQGLLIPMKEEATLVKTPATLPFPFRDSFDAVGVLSADGLLKSRMALSLRSDSEAAYRVLLRQAAPAQWDEAMQYMSNAMGFGGKVSHADLRQGGAGGAGANQL